MSASDAAGDVRAHAGLAHMTTIGSYVTLGTVLVATRLAGLDRSFWHDEIDTITSYVREGPSEILNGAYRPNNHEFFNLLAWATTSVVGESESVLRLWSVLPFIAGVAVVGLWLHLRVGPLTAGLFLALVTFSPLLLDLMRQARGYGLAFMAMAVLVVAALEADRSAATWTITAFCVAGLVGTWTLPNFGVAFVATGAVLLTNPRLRTRVTIAGGVSLLAISVWYAPHASELLESSGQPFGAPIPWYGLLVSPVEQVLAPAMLFIEGPALTTDVTRLPLVAALAVALVVSPLLREARSGVVIGAGTAFTMLFLWAAQISLSPRFVSYLLVPLFMLMASGLSRLLTHRGARPLLRASLAVTMLSLVTVSFVSEAPPVLDLPREANRDAVEIVRHQPADTSLLVYKYHPIDLEYYLGYPVDALTTDVVQQRVCGASATVVYVTQPFGIPPVRLPCTRRDGVRSYRLEQYSRGGSISVWVIPRD